MKSQNITRTQAHLLLKSFGEKLPLRNTVAAQSVWERLLPTGAKLKISVRDNRLTYRVDGYAADGNDVVSVMYHIGMIEAMSNLVWKA